MSENYIVSARKYRPVTFASVVGQRPVTETLKNAIRTGKVAQAYLFCGPRGVGKTTCARILAKTLNCFNRTEDTEACDNCESCRAFREQRSFNIHELDAASNNSVEDIRQLCDQVRIPPQVGKYSIYIIDEVHMLSTQAFNAFLKTLEEPPQHAVFILATTEKHKIIPTILSRCQIFDFNRIRLDDIVQHLTGIAGAEGITCEPEALHVIAERADGGMRDALSIFDQMASFGAGRIAYQDVIANLNVLDYTYFFKITDACLRGDYAFNLLTFDEITRLGFDGRLFINGLADHFRNLLVAKDAVTLKLLDVVESVRKQYQSQAEACSAAFLFAALDVCQACDAAWKTSRNQRLSVELALLKLSVLQHPLPTAAPAAPTALPTAGTSSTSAAPAQPAQPAAAAPARAEATAATATISVQPAPKPAPEKPQPAPKPEKAENAANEASSAPIRPVVEISVMPDEPEPQPEPAAKRPANMISSTETTQPAPKPAAPAPSDNPARPAATAKGQGSGMFSIKATLSGLAATKATPAAGTPAPKAQVSRFPFIAEAVEQNVQPMPFTEDNIQQVWTTFAEGIRQEEPRLSSALATSSPTLGKDGAIVCRLPHEQLANDLNVIKPDLMLYLRTRLGQREISLRTEIAPQAAADATKYYTPAAKLRHMKEVNPLMQDLQQAFNLEID